MSQLYQQWARTTPTSSPFFVHEAQLRATNQNTMNYGFSVGYIAAPDQMTQYNSLASISPTLQPLATVRGGYYGTNPVNQKLHAKMGCSFSQASTSSGGCK